MNKKLWKVDVGRAEIREVEVFGDGELDADGERVCVNTHFATAEEALGKLQDEAIAAVVYAAQTVEHAEEKMEAAREEAADAAKLFGRVERFVRRWRAEHEESENHR